MSQEAPMRPASKSVAAHANYANPSVRYDHKVKYSSDEIRSFKEGHFDIFFKKLCECYQGHFFGLTPPL